MAIKPAINPGVAVADKTATKAGAVNFLGGGAPLGASVVSSAANKIVGFQRGASAVAPKPPDLGSIIQTLSSNILSNVQNSFESANKNIQQFITNNFSERLGEFRGKVEEVTSNPPSKILQNFLSLYRQAIDYIRFLGDRRNIKRLGDNLKALQDVFSESFQVATIIRQTIKKIVKQLSNLPKSNTGPGGLNLDINVPGGPLRKSMPSRRNLMKMGLLGAGLVGAGALGSQVVSGMMDAGGEKIEPTSTDFSGMIPASVMDQFSQILDRFDKAIQSLTKGSQQTPGSAGVPSGGGAESTDDGGGGGGGGGGGAGAGATSMSDTTVSKEVDSTGLKSNFAPIAQDIINSGHIDTTKLSDRAAMGAMLAVGQMETNFDYSKAYTGRGGLNNNMQGFIQLNRGVHPSAAFQSQKGYLDYTVPKFTGKSSTFTGGGTFNPLVFAEKLRNATTGWEVAQALRAGGFTVNDFDPLDTAEEANRLTQDQVQAIKKIVFGNLNLKTTQPTAKVTTPPPAVTPDTSQAQVQRVAAQSVSQVPPQQAPEIQIIPLDMGNTQNVNQAISQATGSGSPVMSNGGVTVPFLSSSNDDNSYTMFTKTVYNILD